jgi:MFS family permease
MTAVVPAAAPPGEVVVERRAWQVLGVSAAGVFVVFLDATVVNIAFPAMSADFAGTSRAQLSWVLNAYAVVFGALLVTAGRLADARGRKRLFFAGLGVFAVASALCGLAPSVPLLVAARALQAVGGALLVEGPGWRWVFWINVPVCALAVVAGRRVLRESAGTAATGRPDVLGVLLVTAVFGLLSLGLVQGQEWGWTSVRVVGAFALAAVLTPVLVARALRHPKPVLPVRLFAVRTFSVATAGTLLFGAAFFAMILANVLFLTSVWDYSVLRTAVAVLPSPLLAALTAPLAGRLADRYGFRVVVVPGALSMVAAQAWFATRTTGEASWLADFLPGSVLAGLAIGFAFSALGAAGAQALPPASFAVGAAVGATARQLGAVLGVAVLVAVLGEPAPADLLAAFHRSWIAIGIAALACAAVCLALGRPRVPPA